MVIYLCVCCSVCFIFVIGIVVIEFSNCIFLVFGCVMFCILLSVFLM